MYIAIMGYGVVGSGVAEVIEMNKKSISGRFGVDNIEVKYILDKRKFPGDANENKIIDCFDAILNDESVKIVVETMGGLHPAYEWVSACLKAGKSVVTSNKELVAQKGPELLSIAKTTNVNFMFEASVGGGIPVIRPINRCLAANKITSVAGILNGTTNYILTKMFSEGTSFEAALKTAQELGYAERDPSADVDGLDACRKICILAALCFRRHIYPESVYTEGIRNITSADVEFAGNHGFVIKLIASAELKGDKVQAVVSPALIKTECVLSGVNDVFNAVLINGNAVGDVVLYGRGAGKLPTASAVVADVMDCAAHIGKRIDLDWADYEEGYSLDANLFVSRFYIRADTDNTDFIDKLPVSCGPEKSGSRICLITDSVSRGEIEKILSDSGIDRSRFTVIRVTEY